MKRPPAVAPRPYRMHNQIQHYAWGKRNGDALIPALLGIDPEPGIPYAELWMGAHPKAPSEIELPDGTTVPLNEWIAAHPEATLGPEVMATYRELPFLLKILSAAESLSIQAHPTKAEAERLHALDPEHYPDTNHKPELAIALDGLTALTGFKPFPELQEVLTRYPEIAEFVGAPVANAILEAEDPTLEEQKALARELFTAMIERAEADPDALMAAVDKLVSRLTAWFEGLREVEIRFLELQQRYGSRDIGLFALFLLNLIDLAPGEGLFTDAGVPHAYLSGNIIECMANSDNVVRVGLTPKFRDPQALLDIVDVTPKRPDILSGHPQMDRGGMIRAVYETPAQEFEVHRWCLAPGTERDMEKGTGPAILLVIEGALDISWGDGHETFRQGEVVFLPACLPGYRVHARDGVEIFQADVPIG
ncbi:MAG: mannose-6-phosphate isomerase, class I [Anaerolineae bacterium]